MATSEEIKLIIRSEMQGAIKDLNSVNKGLGSVDKSNKKLSKSTKKTKTDFMALGAKLLGAVGTIALFAKKASDLEEVTSKFSTVFKDVAIEAERMAKGLQDSYGMSTIESKKLLGNTADLLTGFGMTSEAALQLSNQTQQLAADLGSFNNISAERASLALTKAYFGERESLKELGIIITETSLKERMRAEGMNKLTGNALLQAKADMTLKMAMEQSKNALGDYGRTQDSAANVAKRLANSFEDVVAAIGAEMLPGLANLGSAVIDFMKDGSVLIDVLGTIGKAVGWVAGKLGDLIRLLNAARTMDTMNKQGEGLDKVNKKYEDLKFTAESMYGSVIKLGEAAKRGDDRAIDLKNQMLKVQKESAKQLEGFSKNSEKLGKIEEAMTFTTKKDIDEKIKKREKEKNKFVAGSLTKINATKQEIEARKKIEQEYSDYIYTKNELEVIQENEKYAKMMEFAVANNLSKEAVEQVHQDKLMELKIKNAAKETALMKATSQFFQGTLGINASAYSEYSSFMMNSLDKSSKTQFKIWKAFAIVQATIDTYKAANSAYSAMAGIPFVGPALGAAAAASAIGLGLLNVKKIASAKPTKAARGALIKGSPAGTPITAGEGGKSEAIVPFENDEVMDKFRAKGGSGANVTLSIQNFYAFGNAEQMANDIDRSLFRLYQDNNSIFANAIQDI